MQDEGHGGEAALGSGLLYGCLVGICPASGGPRSPPQRRHSPPMKRGVVPQLTMRDRGISCLCADFRWVWTLYHQGLCLYIDGLKTFLSERKGDRDG